jgi:hypothetical protein
MADSGEKNEKEIISKLYLSLGEAERKLNEIQNTYRTIASSWMLATMGAIGFVLSTKSFEVGINQYLVCWLLALAGAVSIVVIWLLDMRVYQRLLGRFYAEGRAMELGEPWLPQVRDQTRRYFKGRVPLIISIYYVLLFAFLWAVACFFLGWSQEIAKGWHRVAMAIAMALLGAGVAAWIPWIERPKSNTGEPPSKWPDPIPDEKRAEDYARRRKEREAVAKQTIPTDRDRS